MMVHVIIITILIVLTLTYISTSRENITVSAQIIKEEDNNKNESTVLEKVNIQLPIEEAVRTEL